MSLNRTQIISLVLARLGRRGSDTFLSDQAELELGLIQTRLENDPAMMGMWFLLSGETTIATTTADVRTVDLPADFIAEWDGSKLAVYDSTADDPYTELNKDDYDTLLIAFGESDTAKPTDYALVGTQYALFPTPNNAYVLKQNYFKRGDTLSDSTLTNVWTKNADDLLVAELGYIMARYAKNEAAKQEFLGDIAVARQRLKHFNIARDQANKELYRGGKED